MANGLDVGFARAGIMPVPAMGPYGAVAAVGAFGPGTAPRLFSILLLGVSLAITVSGANIDPAKHAEILHH